MVTGTERTGSRRRTVLPIMPGAEAPVYLTKVKALLIRYHYSLKHTFNIVLMVDITINIHTFFCQYYFIYIIYIILFIIIYYYYLLLPIFHGDGSDIDDRIWYCNSKQRICSLQQTNHNNIEINQPYAQYT